VENCRCRSRKQKYIVRKKHQGLRRKSFVSLKFLVELGKMFRRLRKRLFILPRN